MLALLLLIPIAILLIVDYFIADEFRMIAQCKGYCGRKYFWWCFFTGIIGYLMVIALPNASPWREEKKSCPIPGPDCSPCGCRR